MKTSEQIIQLIRQKKFDSVRYACIDRLTINRIDAQAWAFLGQAMIGLKRGEMAQKCLERVALLDPFANWITQAWQDAANVVNGPTDKQILQLLKVQSVPVSACILTRDSSRTIGECLAALMPAVEEIVVVDTGSKDNTVEIVESFGIHVHHFDWMDDFSAARNHAQSLAVNDWIIAVDSDEILADPEAVKLAASLFNDSGMALSVIQLNRVGEQQQPFLTARMYQCSSGVKWTYPIHENLVTAQGPQVARLQTHPINIRLLHDGYDPTATSQPTKIRRNLNIIDSVLKRAPTNHVFLFYRGRELFRLGEFDESLRSLELAAKYDDHLSGFTPQIQHFLEQLHASRTNN